MAQRDRAWRRRKAHQVIAKLKATKAWLFGLSKPEKPVRPHAAQKLRVHWTTEQELREAA